MRRFGARNRHVVDFLLDEVLEAHDPATQELMLRSSILERCAARYATRCSKTRAPRSCSTRWHAPTCSSCRSTTRASGIDSITFSPSCCASSSSTVRGLGADPPSPGIRVAPRQRLARRGDRACARRRRVAEAGELLASAWIDYVQVARHTTVIAWLERFPRELVREDPQLLLVQAWVLSLSAKREPAAEAIAALERLGSLDAGPLPDGFSSVEASLATLRATIPWGDFGAGLGDGRRAAELEGPTSPWRPLVACSLGACLYFSGEFDEAARWLAESTGPALAYRQWRVAVSALASRSLVAGELRQADEQALLAERALDVAREHGSRTSKARYSSRSAHPSQPVEGSTRRLRLWGGPSSSRAPRVIRA